jgi:hypothetical protein
MVNLEIDFLLKKEAELPIHGKRAVRLPLLGKDVDLWRGKSVEYYRAVQ